MRRNPVTGAVIDQYLAFATQEQLRAGDTPKQATPILRPDFQKLMRDMHTCLLCAAQPVDRLAYARDMALFAIAFRTGSRGYDLAKILAPQVLHLLSNQGIVLNLQFTKTLRDGATHASLLVPDKDMPVTCAVAATIRYAQAADSCGWDMSAGYLFPEMSASGERIPKRRARPLSAKAMAARFKQHLEYAGLGARHFTFHSFRVECAVSQTIAGKDIAEIMAAVNWKSGKVASRYVKGATNTRDPTGTTPGAAEARYVTANDLAASLDPAAWALPPPPRRGLAFRRRREPLLRCLHKEISRARKGDRTERKFNRTALSRLSADINEYGSRDYIECDLEHPSGRRATYRQEGRTSMGGYRRRTEASSHPGLQRT